MPNYSNSAFAPLPEVATPGQPAYFFGSIPRDTQDTQMRITNVALTTNVASVTGTIFQGNIPAVGNFISIIGSTNTSGLFNVNQATITSVTGTAATGVYTITFALTHANVVSAADTGMAIIPIAEVAEALANGASVAIYVPSNNDRDLGNRAITVTTTYPSLPTADTTTLYTAVDNNPQAGAAEWTSVGVVGTVAGGAQTVGPVVTFSVPAGRFYRVVRTGVSGGTSPSGISKLTC